MVALCAIWWLLSATATGDLSSPPIGSWSGLTLWADRRDEAEITVVVFRLVAQGLVAYLLVLSAVGSMIRLAPGASTAAIDRFTPAWLVRLLDSSLRVGLAAALGLAAVTVPVAPQPLTPIADELIAGSPDPGVTAGSAEPVEAVPIEGGPMVMRPTNSIATVSDPPAAPSSDSPPDAATIPLPVTPPPSDRIWITELGDHLWRIAEETLAGELARGPSTAEVDRYWRDLVDHNRDRLIDRGNPDLIVPGQEFELPPIG
jgi:hypothetical protein